MTILYTSRYREIDSVYLVYNIVDDVVRKSDGVVNFAMTPISMLLYAMKINDLGQFRDFKKEVLFHPS